jgi:predicted DNA-binding ribbon-helix-helix protein
VAIGYHALIILVPRSAGTTKVALELRPVLDKTIFSCSDSRREVHMCKVYAGQNPERYRNVNRSIRIAGHSTSIQLEAVFWDLLDEIARSQGLTTPKFISTLYVEALEINGGITNFASLLRSTCALYQAGHRPEANDSYNMTRAA